MLSPGVDISFEIRDGYLYAHVTSLVINEQIGREYLTAIADEIDRTDSKRVMICREIPSLPTVSGTFFAADWFVKRAQEVKIAWVNPYPELQERLEFAMTVATNRGGRFRLFDNEADAAEWLAGR